MTRATSKSIKGSVSQGVSPIFWASLLAVTLVVPAPPLHAADQATPSDGDRTVNIMVDGKSVPVKVRDSGNPFKNVNSSSSSGAYDPSRVFSSTSAMANKKFSTSSEEQVKDDSRNHDTFITKSYSEEESLTAPNLHSKSNLQAPTAFSKAADGYDKSYFTSANDDQSHRAVLASSLTASDQNRTAILGGPEKQDDLSDNSMAHKQYLGPGAQHVPANLDVKDNIVLSRVSDLPNRPLSIDEVRNLINHAAKPNTDIKADDSSKPLNDPGYKPDPLRDTPVPPSSSTPVKDDDRDDSVPPPGTIAQPPENSEPLPRP